MKGGDNIPYEGWSNWETWNIVLWIDNDEPIHRERVRHEDPWTAKSAREFSTFWHPTGTLDMDPDDMSKVNWKEVADHWNNKD